MSEEAAVSELDRLEASLRFPLPGYDSGRGADPLAGSGLAGGEAGPRRLQPEAALLGFRRRPPAPAKEVAMFNRGLLKAVTTVIAATGVAVIFSLPASASATPAASASRYRIMQPSSGGNICLDAGFEFSRCQYGPSPDDPPSLEKWILVPAANGSVQIKNGTFCLDLSMFTQPCARGDRAQQWFRVSAENGTVLVVNKSMRFPQCLDSFWTFKTCVKGDKQQIWRFKLVP